MTAALLISMILSFFTGGEPGKLVPDDPAKSAQQIIQKLDGFNIEVKRNCGPTYGEFVTMNHGLNKASGETA
jgi:hypothetical protein